MISDSANSRPFPRRKDSKKPIFGNHSSADPCKKEGERSHKKESQYIYLLSFFLLRLRGTWEKTERDQVQRTILFKDGLHGIISESQPILANSRCLFAKQKFAMLNCHYNATLKRRYHHSCDDTRQPWTETEAGAHTSEQQTILVPRISNPTDSPACLSLPRSRSPLWMDTAVKIIPVYDFIIRQLLNFIKNTENTETHFIIFLKFAASLLWIEYRSTTGSLKISCASHGIDTNLKHWQKLLPKASCLRIFTGKGQWDSQHRGHKAGARFPL